MTVEINSACSYASNQDFQTSLCQFQMADWCTEILTELAVHDPTWLSEIHQKYEKYVELLLRSSDPALVGDIEPQQLQNFRNMYGGQSYFCRYSTCASSTNGFSSQGTRDQHEAAHVRKYKCDVLNCFMGNQGFKNERELKLHCQKYHPKPKFPDLVIDLPSPTQDPSCDIVEGLTIKYAPDLERVFALDPLYQFRSEFELYSVAISPDERYFAMGGRMRVYIYNLESGTEVMWFELDGPGAFQDEGDSVLDLLFTTDNEFLIGATEAGRVMVCYQASIS